MALRIRSARKYLSVGAVAAVIVVAGLHSIAPPEKADAAVILPASILCAPNTCNSNRALDSLQDVTLYNTLASRSSGEQWRIKDGNSGLADRQLIEIANQGNHYMERVVLGVYITDDLYNAMPGRQVPIRFVDRDCDTGGNPAWNIEVRTPGSATATAMASYNGGSRIANRNAFCNTRNNSYANQTWFNLAQYKNRFQRYSGGSLWYTEIVVRMTNFSGSYNKDDRNARFQVRLDNAACAGMSACRQYVALVSQDNRPYDTSTDHRNFALSTRAPSQIQKKVTTNGSKDDDRDQYVVFGRKTEQKLIRQFMEFGLSCDINSPTQKSVYIYDVNDGDNAGAETHGWVGGRDIVGVVLQYYNETTNAWQLVPQNQIVAPTGSSGWSYAGSHNSNGITPRNHYLYSVGGAGYPSTVILPKDDDRVESVVRFTMMPRTKYRIAVTPDDGGNFMAVGLPGDQMYGLVGCDTYDLSPKITTGSGSIQAGTPATFNNTIVSNASSSATAVGIKWQSYGFVLRAGQAVPGVAGDKSTDYGSQAVACAGLTLCQVIGGNMGVGETVLPGTELTPYRLTSYTNTGALGSGDRVCSFMAISPFQLPEGSNSWRVSNVVCRLILTVPKVQVLGNDLRVGSGFSGGTYLNAMAKGMVSDGSASWVEYAITAPRAVTTLASQSGAVNGSSDAQSVWSKLTFANTGTLPGCPDGFGCFNAASNLGTIPNVSVAVSTMNNGGTPLARNVGATPISVSGGAGTSLSSILGGADMGNFTQSAAIITTGTITIDQDITYGAGPYANEAAMPQLILIGGNININSNVHRVDAWLVASGTVNTCGEYAQSAVRENNCNNKLTVNGPIMASQLLLDRTYRNPAQPADAAEVLNLRGDAFIWANRMARQNGHWQTVYTTELPPRY